MGIPPDVKDIEGLETRALFEKCLGKTFPIAGLENVDGLPYHLVKLDVGAVLGKASYLDTIWIEPTYLQLEESHLVQWLAVLPALLNPAPIR